MPKTSRGTPKIDELTKPDPVGAIKKLNRRVPGK